MNKCEQDLKTIQLWKEFAGIFAKIYMFFKKVNDFHQKRGFIYRLQKV